MSFRERSFNFIMAFLLFTGLFIFFSPLISINEIIYPVRIDSVYVRIQQEEYKRHATAENKALPESFYFLPSQLNMEYQELNIPGTAGKTLKGWFIPGYRHAATLIIIHDLNESRINWLAAAKQFNDRGFSIVLADLPAHGESGGLAFQLGEKESGFMKALIDSIYPRILNKSIAVLGKGIGAGIALNAARADSRINCVVAQSIPDKLPDYIYHFAEERWGALNTLFYPVMQRQLYRILEFDPDSVVYSKRAVSMPVPVLFIAGNADRLVPSHHTRAVFDSCGSARKEFWPVQAGHNDIEAQTGEEYYNRISIFMVNSFPKTIRKSRFRKLVYNYNDH